MNNSFFSTVLQYLSKTGHFFHTRNGHIFSSSLIFFLTVFIFAFFTAQTPYVLDDYFAFFKNPEGVPLFQMQFNAVDRILHLSDVAESQWNLFFNWSGRIFFLFTIQILCMGSKIWFNILNGFAAACVIRMIAVHAAGKQKVRTSHYLLLSSLFWISCPAPGLTLFWMNGAVCYLWTALFYLLFFYPFRMAFEYGTAQVRHPKLLIPALFFAGLIGCNANENTAGTVLLFSGILLFLIFRSEHKIPVWGISGMLGGFAGFALLLFAPGLKVRMAAEGHIVPDIAVNFFLQTGYLFQSIYALFPLCIFLGIILFTVYGKKYFIKSGGRTILLFILMGLCSVYVMILSPYAPSRAVFGSFIFLLCAFGKMLHELPQHGQIQERIIPASALSAFLIALFSMAFAFRDIAYTRHIQQNRIRYVMLQKKEKNQQDFVFRSMAGTSPYNALYKTDILKEDSNAFVNQFYAHELGIRSIRVVDEPNVVGMRSAVLPGEQLE